MKINPTVCKCTNIKTTYKEDDFYSRNCQCYGFSIKPSSGF